MQYIIVKFLEDRKVLIDGQLAGLTNTIMEVDEGVHEIYIDGPIDYSPYQVTINIADTSPLEPKEIVFFGPGPGKP